MEREYFENPNACGLKVHTWRWIASGELEIFIGNFKNYASHSIFNLFVKTTHLPWSSNGMWCQLSSCRYQQKLICLHRHENEELNTGEQEAITDKRSQNVFVSLGEWKSRIIQLSYQIFTYRRHIISNKKPRSGFSEKTTKRNLFSLLIRRNGKGECRRNVKYFPIFSLNLLNANRRR